MKKGLLLLALVLSMVACNVLSKKVPPVPILPTPVVTPAYSSIPLTPDNVEHATELECFVEGGAGPVAALAFAEDSIELLSAHAKEGRLRRWRVNDGSLITSLDIGAVGLVATTFDKGGNSLAVAAGNTPRASQAGYAFELEGVYVWDTRTGKSRLVLSPTKFSDVALSPDGRWVAAVSGIGLDFADTMGLQGDSGLGLGNYESPSTINEYDVVAFDAVGEYVAIGSENGSIRLRRWNGLEVLEGVDLVDAASGLPAWHTQPVSLPLAIAFDPSRRWLGAVRSESVEIYDLSNRRLSFSMKIANSPAAALAFDPSGNLFAVGTKDGWQIFGMDDKKLLAENTEGAVYAVTFSPDGRLFAWGDVDGTVHLWGVPKN